MVLLLLLLLLLSAAYQASQAVQSPNRTALLLPRGPTATRPQQRYLSLPTHVDSDVPLLPRDFFSPARGTGQEALPEPVRELLLPAWPHASGPPRASGAAVTTLCERNKMQVQVERSVLGPGEPGSHLKLGTCSVSSSTEDHVYFEYDLRMCGTKRTTINNQMVYFNMLHHEPPKPRGAIRRTAPFSVPVACYFNRFVYSYKVGYTPKVQRRKVLKKMKTSAKFVLTPRNAEWTKLSRSEAFVLGEPVFFAAQAEALSSDERLYVHTCYVTPQESHTSTPQFPVVTNFGCIVESKNGRSRFIPHRNNAVRFSLDAFVFKGVTGQQLYMHCSMFVGNSTPTPTAKSCNYDTKVGRWVELFGSESVCDCCESRCSSDQSTETEVISSASWTINAEVKSAAPNQRRKTAGSTRELTEATAGRKEEKLRPAEVLAVQMGGGAEGRLVKESPPVDGEEKVSVLQAIFEDIFDFD